MTTPAIGAEPAVYREAREVLEGDVDELGHMSNVAFVRLIQDVARAHSAAAGWDLSAYLAAGAIFVVRRHEIDYLAQAAPGTPLVISTWIARFSAASSRRETRVTHATTGAELLRASTLWAFVSTETGRPTRIPKALTSAFAAFRERGSPSPG